MKATFVRFDRGSANDFYQTLKARVNEYFESQNLSKYSNAPMVVKSIVLIAVYLVPYFLIVTGVAGNYFLLAALWALMGLGMAGVGFNVMHDANHGSYSRHQWINEILGRFLNLLGGNAMNWRIQHNVLHHSYTNIHGLDEDIEVGPYLRFSPDQPWYKFHRYQHIYIWVLYTMLTLLWITDKEFKQLVKWKNTGFIESQGRTFWGMMWELILSKAFYYFVFLALPLAFSSAPWWLTLAFFIGMHMIAGFISSVIFQLAHVVPDADFPLPDDKGNMENTWAVHQLATTCDFAPKNKILSWYIGGLNFQVVHHLFPNICHIHYPKLAKIVQDTANEFGLRYHVQPSFRSAVYHHTRLLKQFGSKA